MPEVVSDTSPIQYLHQCNLLELLPHLYGRVLVPDAVLRELGVGRSQGVFLPDVAALPWLIPRSAPPLGGLPLAADLGAGEREAIALAAGLRNPLLLLDDSLARQHARLLNLPFTGTLGVVLRGKERRVLDLVAPVIEQLERLGFRLDRATREAVLALAGELRT